MLSEAKRYDLARRFVYDTRIEEAEHFTDDSIIVKNVQEVIHAYAEDLKGIEDIFDNFPTDEIDAAIRDYFADDSVEGFLNRHNIEWD